MLPLNVGSSPAGMSRPDPKNHVLWLHVLHSGTQVSPILVQWPFYTLQRSLGTPHTLLPIHRQACINPNENLAHSMKCINIFKLSAPPSGFCKPVFFDMFETCHPGLGIAILKSNIVKAYSVTFSKKATSLKGQGHEI